MSRSAPRGDDEVEAVEDVDEEPAEEPYRVVVAGGGAFHRPAESSTRADPEPACRCELMEREAWKVWGVGKAEAWKEPCQQSGCYGDPDPSGGSTSRVFVDSATEVAEHLVDD